MQVLAHHLAELAAVVPERGLACGDGATDDLSVGHEGAAGLADEEAQAGTYLSEGDPTQGELSGREEDADAVDREDHQPDPCAQHDRAGAAADDEPARALQQAIDELAALRAREVSRPEAYGRCPEHGVAHARLARVDREGVAEQ